MLYMIKFASVILVVLIASFTLSYLSSEYQKQYIEPAGKQNERIYPFYELWIYIGIIVIVMLVVSKYLHKIKNGHSK